MQILIVHDQLGEIRSVAIPGHEVRSGNQLWRPTASEQVAVVDIPDFPAGTDLEIALERIRREFRLSKQRACLISKSKNVASSSTGDSEGR